MAKVDIWIETSTTKYTMSSENGDSDNVLPLLFELVSAIVAIRSTEKDKLLSNIEKLKVIAANLKPFDIEDNLIRICHGEGCEGKRKDFHIHPKKDYSDSMKNHD